MKYNRSTLMLKELPYVGSIEADVLRILWDAGEPIPIMDIYYTNFDNEIKNKTSPSSLGTIRAAVNRLIGKRLIRSAKSGSGTKKLFASNVTREEFLHKTLSAIAEKFGDIAYLRQILGEANAG